MSTVRRAWPIAVVAVALAGCTSSTATHGDNPVISPPATTPAAPSASVPVSSSALPSTPPATTSAATTSNAPSSVVTSPAAPSTAPVVRSTCTRLTIRVIPGGASMGQEIAALQFTNDTNTTCRLVGYATVVLLRAGKVIGRPALRATTATSVFSIAPGGTVESLLHDYVGNCQAPLSDTVRVTAPGTAMSTSRPMQLRACLLRLDPLGEPN